MKRLAIATVAALALVSSTAVYAQYRPWFHEHMQRFSAEDRTAFVDARIAAVHAGLKLNADQEKLWPPVEAAVREFAKMRIDRAEARMKGYVGEACPECGNFTMVRNGTCLKCDTCGATTGCS